MTPSLPVLCKKLNNSYTRDYNEDFHDKNTSKSTSLKICTAIETVLFRLTTGRLDSDAKGNASCKFSTKQILILFFREYLHYSP